VGEETDTWCGWRPWPKEGGAPGLTGDPMGEPRVMGSIEDKTLKIATRKTGANVNWRFWIFCHSVAR
jgi:hypothetical protein